MGLFKEIDIVNLEKLKVFSNKLAKKVKNSDFNPEHILYIERAGLFIAREIANSLNCNISGIYASRRGSSIKSKINIILRCLPKRITDFLRRIEEQSNLRGAQKERNVYMKGNLPPYDKNILIVDDAIDTGYSILAVIDFLVSRGYQKSKIRAAVITTTRNNPEYHTDFSLFYNTSFAFPWSYTSKEYKLCWEMHKRYKTSLVV